MATIGWYGPLIDLSEASSHINDYVQLLVFVHKSNPVQYKLSKKGEVIRTDIQVGDETRPFFWVSIWKRQMGSMMVAGDVILLQNVRITRFRDMVEARTTECSSFQCLVHSHEFLASRGVDELIGNCWVRITTKKKLQKVIEWVLRAGLTLHNVGLHNYDKEKVSRNWKVHEDTQPQDCLSLLEVSLLTYSCKAIFHAFAGEIFLPITWTHLQEFDKERMFISRRLYIMGDDDLAEDLICTGCQLCGTPLNSELGSVDQQNNIPLYCENSSNRLHVVSSIYRPFMFYVWDDSKYIPLHVKNKGAELLFGNITAERVYFCYKRQKHRIMPDPSIVQKEGSHARAIQPNAADGGIASCSQHTDKTLGQKRKEECDKKTNFYLIWLVMLKLLLKKGENSPMKFVVNVDGSKDWESGRYEMLSVSMPCFQTNAL